jgi:aminoglycoside phosphotransferase (APT) family kinase protein
MHSATGKMHVDEVESDARLVRRLLAAQFPPWAELPIAPVHSAGTDNALYGIGDDKVVRLPRIRAAVAQIDKEHEWLPRLAPFLPLPIPVPLAKGVPAQSYPWRWSIYRWLEGESATIERIANHCDAAVELTQFLVALQRIDAARGPPPGAHNSFRGAPLATRDDATRTAITALSGTLDVAAATSAWEAALRASEWKDAPVWIHGDLQPGNLLVQHGRLGAVIDFGCLGVGDPACDLIVAWNLLSAESRGIFRAALRVDDATWARGAGWALSIGLIAVPYYQTSNPILAGINRFAIEQVLAAHREAI